MSDGSLCIIISDEEDAIEDDRNDCIIMNIEDSPEEDTYNMSHKTKKKKTVEKKLLKMERKIHELRWRCSSNSEVIKEKEKRIRLQRTFLRKYIKHLDILTGEAERKDVAIAEGRQKNILERLEMESERAQILLETEKVREKMEEIAKEREIVTEMKSDLEKEQRKNVRLKWEMEEGNMNRIIHEQRLRIEHEEEINILNKQLEEAFCHESGEGDKIELEKTMSFLRVNIEEEENIIKHLREQLIPKDDNIKDIAGIVSNVKIQFEELMKTSNNKQDDLKSVMRNKEGEMNKSYEDNVKIVENEEVSPFEHVEVPTVQMENEEVPSYSSKLRSGWNFKLKTCDFVAEGNPCSMTTVVECKCFTACVADCVCRQGDILCGLSCSCDGNCTIGSLGSETLLEVKPSLIPGAGLGCFVTKSVPVGFLLQEYTGHILGSNISDNNPSSGPSYLVKLTNKLDIDGSKGGSHVIRANHSNRPNCELYTKYVRVPGGLRCAVFVRTKRHLKSGQEITLDYGPEYPTKGFH